MITHLRPAKPLLMVMFIIIIAVNISKNAKVFGATVRGRVDMPVLQNDNPTDFLLQEQQHLILRVQANPASLTNNDLDFIANSFLDAYKRQQEELECNEQDNTRSISAARGGAYSPSANYNIITIESAKILTNIIESFVSEPRTISASIDFSMILQIKYICDGCNQGENDNYVVSIFKQEIENNASNNNNFVHHNQQESIHRDINYFRDGNHDMIERISNDRPRSTASPPDRRVFDSAEDAAKPGTRDIYQHPQPDVSSNPFTSSYFSTNNPTACVPLLSNVLSDFQISIMLAEQNSPVDAIYSLDLINQKINDSSDHCIIENQVENENEQNEFSSYITMGVNGNRNIDDIDDQKAILERVLIQTYNEMNIMNPEICDPHSNIVTKASIENMYSVPSSPESWYFITARLEGTCVGESCAIENKCLMRDLSNLATCEKDTSHQRLLEIENGEIPASSQNTFCFCTNGEVGLSNLPSSTEFSTNINQSLKVLRDTTEFTMIESVGILVESEQQRAKCCGGTSGIPVTGSLQDAVTDYINNEGTSIHGTPINCWDVSALTTFDEGFRNQITFNEPLNCWDTSSATSMKQLFYVASNFNQDLTNFDVSKVTQFSGMFEFASSFNGDISNWQMTSATHVGNMFRQASSFDRDISSWSMSTVVNMGGMFSGASIFNQNIGSWNTSSTTDTQVMFFNAEAFNQDLSFWDTSSVTTMRNMFNGALVFNGDVSNWVTSQVTVMHGMFGNTLQFNIPLNNWDTSKVTLMSNMFIDASAFNQPLNNWDVSKVTTMRNMFRLASVFNQDISGWNVSSLVVVQFMFNSASLFNQDLCDWRSVADNIDYSSATFVFAGTNCDETSSPVPDAGPWCKECPCENEISIEIQTNSVPEETAIEIWKDYDGPSAELMWSKYDFTEPNTIYMATLFCIPSTGCYSVKFMDLGGDGTCCNTGSGYIRVSRTNDGSVIMLAPGLFSFEHFLHGLGDGCVP